MQSTSLLISVIVWSISIMCANVSYSDELKSTKLPDPQIGGGRPLMEVLRDRSSSRSFSTEKLPDQILSNMLWAAFGINRPDTGKRTAPSVSNRQEIDIYLATAEGLYLYDAKNHALKPVVSGDFRSVTGTQDFVKEAPVNLIYVANVSKIGTSPNKDLYSAVDTGFISQNVYLYCSSEGLATVVRGAIDKRTLEKTMKLRPDQKVILAQSVGYPKK